MINPKLKISSHDQVGIWVRQRDTLCTDNMYIHTYIHITAHTHM